MSEPTRYTTTSGSTRRSSNPIFSFFSSLFAKKSTKKNLGGNFEEDDCDSLADYDMSVTSQAEVIQELEYSITELTGPSWEREMNEMTDSLHKQISNVLKSQKTDRRYCVKCDEEYVRNLAREIMNNASREVCGIRGCTVYLRLLHEDIAQELISKTSLSSADKRCVSWPDAPKNPAHGQLSRQNSAPAKNSPLQRLDYQVLPDLDAKLTQLFSPDTMSTDSGFGDVHPSKRKLQRSMTEVCASYLPTISSASPVGAPCVDLGRVEFDPETVSNFELYVYLSPAISWTWPIKKFFAPSLSTEDLHKNVSQNKMTFVPLNNEFTLVKKKLFRPRCNSNTVIRCNFNMK